ncbi:hypothetical protein F5884DRAFT_747062 [Xylogone sp. PMI_703]|nr:hypothetical protein F5884DRAFT_747062 [Xylogone sp. PMI_703]
MSRFDHLVTPISPSAQREYQRSVRRNLRNLFEPTWGFTIFRTTYTPESDTQFPLFLAKLDLYVKYSIDTDLNPDFPGSDPSFDTAPNEEMMRPFKNDVVEDNTLSGASVDEVRDAFAKWLEGKGVDLEITHIYAPYRVCIMADEAVLNSVMAGPDDPSLNSELDTVWVKMVEYSAPGEEKWQGWLKVGLNALYYFWSNVSGGEEVRGMFEFMEERSDVFTG